MRIILSFGILLLVFCASCAEASRKMTSESTKMTREAQFKEILVGQDSKTPIRLTSEELKFLPACLSVELADPNGFQLRILKTELTTSLKECLSSNNYLEKLEGAWVWTPNVSIPKDVKKNWISISIPSTSSSAPSKWQKVKRE